MFAKKIFLVCALAFVLAACTSAQQRGVVGNTYVSTSRPVIAVHVKDLPPVTSGRGTAVLYDPNKAGALSLTVRTAVFGTEKAVAAVTHAALPNAGWIWTTVYPRVGGTDVVPEIIDGTQFAAFTYLVPMANDPYAGLVGDPLPEQEKQKDNPRTHYWLARYMALRTNFNEDKIILEYREPAPEGLTDVKTPPYGMNEQLAAFEKRARETFSLVELPDDLGSLQAGYPQGVRWRYMSDAYLGDVMQQTPLDVR